MSGSNLKGVSSQGALSRSARETPKTTAASRKLFEDVSASDLLMKSLGTEGALLRSHHLRLKPSWKKASALINNKNFCREISRSDYQMVPPELADVDIWENQPRLDLRVLAAVGLMRLGEETEVMLSWRMHPDILDCHTFIDLRERKNPFLVLMFGTRIASVRQILPLSPIKKGQGDRYKFVCGEVRAEVVGYRFRRFAPRILQRLVNQSQRKVREDPAERMVKTLRDREMRRRGSGEV